MASSANTEACYVALLGLAENFRTSNPPNIKLCIHCLQSILTLHLAPKTEARTRVQLGNILLAHTKNIDLAKSNLEKAVIHICIFVIFYILYIMPAKGDTIVQLIVNQSSVHVYKNNIKKSFV